MISIWSGDGLHTIVVLNPKGGCGKTTLATNIASFYAQLGANPTLIDLDPQGFCLRWLEKRPERRPAIHAVGGYDEATGKPARAIAVSPDSKVAVIDAPAAIPNTELHNYTHIADTVLLPVMPSEIDVHSATRFVAELLLDAQLDRREQKLAIVANRVRARTRSYQRLMHFLARLEIPMITALRDSQNYVYAAAHGLGVCDMPAHRAADDRVAMSAAVDWLEKRRAVTERRQTMIERAAYGYAERRGFATGDPMADWLEAEREIDAELGERAE